MTIKQLYQKLCSPEFQDTDNGGLAYNFYIYQYPAEKEYDMRENIVDFCDKLSRPAIFVDVLAINLFKEFCAYLDSTPMGEGTVLTDSLDSEAEYPEDILNELTETARSSDFYDYLHNRINEHLTEQQTGNAKPYVFVYGIGSMFPYLRANVFLTCMEQFNQVNQYKMILFYPGESKGNSYSLFSKLEDMHAYRGTLLNYTEE